MPGAIIGSIVFARLSDRLAQKDIMARVNLIVFSIFTLFIALIIIFLVPIPHISAEQGKNVGFLITQWGFLGFGILLFIIRGVLSIYHINQSPILQKINLPEAQGTVSAYNQFLETIGMGIGPVLAGYLLTVFNGNYLYTAIISLLVGLPSALFWLLIRRWIHRDIANIDVILQQRASELAKNNSIK
jgi:MFS family permease